MAQHVLSSKEIKLLQRLLDKNRGITTYEEIKPEDPPIIGSAAEVYIAKIPTGGIDGRTGLTPGSEDCDIYRIVDGDLEEVETLSKLTYNLATDDIPAGYAPVVKDKWGNWLAIVSLGGGEGGVELHLGTLSADCAIGSETASVTPSDPGTGTGTASGSMANPCGFGGVSGTSVIYGEVDGEDTVIAMGIVSIAPLVNVRDDGATVEQERIAEFGGYAVSTTPEDDTVWTWVDCQSEEE